MMPWMLCFGINGIVTKGLGGIGWVGDVNWRVAVNMIKNAAKNTTIKSINGQIPTLKEAISLIKAAGGTIIRVEGAHAEGGVSTHTFPHINFITANGNRVAIQIK
jgi:hypothetical protein